MARPDGRITVLWPIETIAKNDGAKINFDDERYLGYVPVRLPWTICVHGWFASGRRRCARESNARLQ